MKQSNRSTAYALPVLLFLCFFPSQHAQSTHRSDVTEKKTTKYSNSSHHFSVFSLSNQKKILSKKQRRFALVVGVAKYPDERNNLDSPAKDADQMAKEFKKKGFKVKRLIDSEATAAKVREGMEWLVKHGQDPQSSLVFYYSGHGHQASNPESQEADKKDETLFPHELPTKSNFSGHIRDKEINAFSEKIKGKLFLIFDSCHSGDSARSAFSSPSLDAKGWVELLHAKVLQKRYCDAPNCPRPPPLSKAVLSALDAPPAAHKLKSTIAGFEIVADPPSTPTTRQTNKIQKNTLLLSAARDSEKALDLSNGSLLTKSILYVLRRKNAYKLTHEQFYKKVLAHARYLSHTLIGQLCEQEAFCRPKLKEIKQYLHRTNYMTQHPQLEGGDDLKNSRLFFLEGEGEGEGEGETSTITVFLDGFKPEATNAWTAILTPLNARVISSEDAEVSISHDGKILTVLYKKRPFLALPADASQADELEKSIKRIFESIHLVKQWSRFHQKTSGLQTSVLLKQKNQHIKLQGDIVGIGSRIRIQILSNKSCYPVIINLTNEGNMRVLHPYEPNNEITLFAGKFIFPSSGNLAVKEPKGLGLVMAFCSEEKQDVQALRQRILDGKYQPPTTINERIKRSILSYYVQ